MRAVWARLLGLLLLTGLFTLPVISGRAEADGPVFEAEKEEWASGAEAAYASKDAPYYGVIGARMSVHKWGDENSPELGVVEPNTIVDVFKKGRTWTRIAFEGGEGYVRTKFIERVQRKNPFDGPMPGTSRHTAVGCVLVDTQFQPEGYRYPIKVSAGSWISIERIRDGRAYFPYRREPDDVSLGADKFKLYDFVPWDEAQPGDLLYAFTSFYSTSETKEGNAGRMYNIDLASERLTSIRVEEGESFSFNAVCGPYTKETGYRSAPILSGESHMGYGGGVCQVASTLYNIVLRVPMVIEDMNWHSQGGTKYLPAGFDATVSNSKDLVFRNVLPYPLRIEFENKDGVMTAFLFRDYER